MIITTDGRGMFHITHNGHNVDILRARPETHILVIDGRLAECPFASLGDATRHARAVIAAMPHTHTFTPRAGARFECCARPTVNRQIGH